MNEFIDSLIEYIKTNFENDDSIKTKVNVCKAYKSNLLPSPKIVVYVVDDSEAEQYSTFEGENVSRISVQITSFADQMKISGKTVSAQDAADIFSDRIRSLFQKKKLFDAIPGVLQVRRVGRTFAMPFGSGEKTYMSPVRFEIQIKNKM